MYTLISKSMSITVLRLNFGTPKITNFPFGKKMENYRIICVPILENISVILHLLQTSNDQVTLIIGSPRLFFVLGLEYIKTQDPEILKLRIEIMMKENCEEFALNLCTWSLKHPQLKNDLKIKEHQIVIMYRQQLYEKMQEVVSEM